MTFCTAVNCMDGRVQLPVIDFLKKRFGVDYVDMITEAGPCQMFGQRTGETACDSITQRITVSVVRHRSKAIAVAGHYDCAGNPVSKEEQIAQIRESVACIKERFSQVEVIGLWVDENWSVSEIRYKAESAK